MNYGAELYLACVSLSADPYFFHKSSAFRGKLLTCSPQDQADGTVQLRDLLLHFRRRYRRQHLRLVLPPRNQGSRPRRTRRGVRSTVVQDRPSGKNVRGRQGVGTSPCFR